MQKVFALIADIVDSRSMENRSVLQRHLKNTLMTLSESSPDSYLSPLTLTLGDEFQAVYADFSVVLTDMLDILALLAPYKLRIAVAYGALSTDINPRAALEMDGPAFNLARDCMETLKKQHTTSIRLEGLAADRLALINTCLTLAGNALSDWKPATFRIACGLKEGNSVQEIAEKLGVTPRAVNKNIATNHIRDILTSLDVVTGEVQGTS
ncbi:SatD family protein [Marispirochaeta sp.]|jgi:hypothetical protein|uniref:SatD family protein n=1 Tax=Marispirochaeta sp. TaxID=2038653 RepID=UPI0029C70C5C|nr:SatD family protein [Marispirochaeta sp.]